MWGNLFHFMSRASRGNPFSRTTFLIDFLIALTVYCGALDRRIANIEIELALVFCSFWFLFFVAYRKIVFTGVAAQRGVVFRFVNLVESGERSVLTLSSL